MNPLLDFSGLPRFADFKPELVTPAVDQLLGENRALVERVAGARGAGHLARFRRAARGRERAPRPRVGPGRASERGDEQPRAARGLQREPAEGHAVLHRALPAPGAVREVQGAARRAPSSTRSTARSARSSRTSCATSGWAAPSCRRRRRRASWRSREQLSQHLLALLRQPARRDERLLALRRPTPRRSPGIPQDVLQAAREAAQADGRPGWKFTLHAPSYFPVMQYADNRGAARADVPRLRDARLRVRQAGMGQHAAHHRDRQAAAASWRGCSASRTTPSTRSSPRWPSRRGRCSSSWNELAARAKPYAERDLDELKEFARAELGLDRLESWDLAYASEKLRVARYAFSDQEVKQYFPETTRAARHVPADRDALRADDRARRRRRCGIRTCASTPIRDRDGRADRAVLRRSLRAAVQARRRLDGRRDHAAAQGRSACRRRSPTSTATSRRRCRRQAGALHARRGHHAVPRVRPRPAPPADARRRSSAYSGINGVEWDAVELPSPVHGELLLGVGRARADDARTWTPATPLPRALFDKMLAAKNFQSGLQTVRQLEFALFDLHLHYDFDPDGDRQIARSSC